MRVCRIHRHLVEKLDPRDGNAALHRGDHRLHRAAYRLERADGRGDRLGDGLQPHRDLGDHAERALRADEELGQVVAGGRFLHPPPGRDDLACGRDHAQRQHVFPHGAVAHRRRAARPRRGHAAERSVCAGIDREEQAHVAQVRIELLARHAGLDHRVEILAVDGDDPRHAADVERDAALQRDRMAFHRGARGKRRDRNAVLETGRHHALHLVLALREHHRVRQPRRLARHVVAMMLAHRVRH